MTKLREKKIEDRIIKILAIIGLFIGFDYFVFYFTYREPGSYTIIFILLYLLLPVVTLVFFIVPNYEKVLAFLVIQNFIELLLNPKIVYWSWLFSLLFFLVLVIPQFIVLKHIKQPFKMKKTTRNILILIFSANLLIYFGFVLFDLWKVLQPDVIANGSFTPYILYITRHFIRLISYLCITLILFKYFGIDKEQIEE